MSAPLDTDGRPEGAGRLPRDLLAGLAIIAFCALAYWVTLGFDEAPAAIAQNVQPATFPRLVITVIAILAAVMVALGLPSREPRRRLPPLPVFVTGAMMVAFVVAMQQLGIVCAMVLFALVMPILWGERRPLHLVAFAILFPAAVWVVFVELLDVHFDAGFISQFLG